MTGAFVGVNGATMVGGDIGGEDGGVMGAEVYDERETDRGLWVSLRRQLVGVRRQINQQRKRESIVFIGLGADKVIPFTAIKETVIRHGYLLFTHGTTES